MSDTSTKDPDKQYGFGPEPLARPGAVRVLITAGPTHEPIDAVRFLGNRSSGRMGIALAEAAKARGASVDLLLGPATVTPPAELAESVRRFRTCEDLRLLLGELAGAADIIIMAAAVADYRPKPLAALSGGKFRRTSGNIMLELESTPDLIAGVSASRRPGQLIVGFALEPRAEMIASAHAKLDRKKIDMVVANPLETMDSGEIEAVLVSKCQPDLPSPGVMSKADCSAWLMERFLSAFAKLR